MFREQVLGNLQSLLGSSQVKPIFVSHDRDLGPWFETVLLTNACRQADSISFAKLRVIDSLHIDYHVMVKCLNAIIMPYWHCMCQRLINVPINVYICSLRKIKDVTLHDIVGCLRRVKKLVIGF